MTTHILILMFLIQLYFEIPEADLNIIAASISPGVVGFKISLSSVGFTFRLRVWASDFRA